MAFLGHLIKWGFHTRKIRPRRPETPTLFLTSTYERTEKGTERGREEEGDAGGRRVVVERERGEEGKAEECKWERGMGEGWRRRERRSV